MVKIRDLTLYVIQFIRRDLNDLQIKNGLDDLRLQQGLGACYCTKICGFLSLDNMKVHPYYE